MHTVRSSLFLILALLLASTQLPVRPAKAQSGVALSSNTDMHWAHSDGNNEGFDVHAAGEIVFLADDSGVARISEGGFLTIEIRENGRRLHLDVRPSPDGGLTYDYRLNGRRLDYALADNQELADLFLMIIRETGIGAPERVARILKSDGVAGVFEEIDQMESGSSVRRYLLALVEQGDLNARELQRVASLAQSRIQSSGDRARLLRMTASYFLAESGAVDAYFDAVESIPSPGDKSRTLRAVLELKPDRAAMLRLINVTRGVQSSGDKTRVLMTSVEYFTGDEAVRDAYFQAVETIGSSGDRSRLLRALLTEYEIDAATAELAFQNAAGIQSSGDKARVLIQAAPHYTNTAAQRKYFFEAVSTIGSSGDHARVLLALLSSENLDKPTLLSLLDSVHGISSSGDAGRVLRAAAQYMTDDDLVDAYLSAAQTIGSPGDRGRALTALMDQ